MLYKIKTDILQRVLNFIFTFVAQDKLLPHSGNAIVDLSGPNMSLMDS